MTVENLWHWNLLFMLEINVRSLKLNVLKMWCSRVNKNGNNSFVIEWFKGINYITSVANTHFTAPLMCCKTVLVKITNMLCPNFEQNVSWLYPHYFGEIYWLFYYDSIDSYWFFLCRLRSIAAHRDHFVWRLSVRLSMCLASNIFLVVTQSCFAGDPIFASQGSDPLRSGSEPWLAKMRRPKLSLFCLN